MIQGSNEWIEFRKSHIGGSDSPVIMGVSPYCTPYQLWQEKLGIKKRAKTESMNYGNTMEPFIRDKFNEMYDCKVEPVVLIHPTIKWMMASLDGLDEKNGIAVEIKTANKEDHDMAKNGQVPDKYYPQLQHTLEILVALFGINQIYYFSYNNGDYASVLMQKHDEYITKLLKEEHKFFIAVQDLEAPELSDRDYVDKSSESTWLELENELYEIIVQLKSLEDREKKLRDHLIAQAGGQSAKGNKVKVTKYYKKGTVDYKKVPELNGVDLEKYRKASTECWRLTMGE